MKVSVKINDVKSIFGIRCSISVSIFLGYDNLTAYYPGRPPFADWQGDHSPDPMSGTYPSLNPYLYCAGNPVTNTDPTGCIIDYGDPVSNGEDDAPDMRSIKDRLEGLAGRSQMMTFLFNYIKDSDKKVLARYERITSVNDGSEIYGQVEMLDREETGYDMLLRISPENHSENVDVEELYHVFQNMFPNRDANENKEFEAKNFTASMFYEATLIGNHEYTDDSPQYWRKIAFWNGLNATTVKTKSFQQQYLNVGQEFLNKHKTLPINSPYRTPITKIPNSLIWILENYNK